MSLDLNSVTSHLRPGKCELCEHDRPNGGLGECSRWFSGAVTCQTMEPRMKLNWGAFNFSGSCGVIVCACWACISNVHLVYCFLE